MSLLDAFLHTDILIALLLYAALSILVEFTGYKLLVITHEVEITYWIINRLTIPTARATAVIIFILLAYPAIFCLEYAPSIGELLTASHHKLTNIINVIFITSLLLPMIPIFNRLPALVLPIQGIIAASMVFRWYLDKLHESQPVIVIHYWPDWITFIGLLIMAFFSHEFAKWLSHFMEKRFDEHLDILGSGQFIYRSITMVLQVPVILLYTLFLGNQL